MAVRADLGQVFYFGGIAPAIAEFWVSTGAIWWDMLLAEAFVPFLFYLFFTFKWPIFSQFNVVTTAIIIAVDILDAY